MGGNSGGINSLFFLKKVIMKGFVFLSLFLSFIVCEDFYARCMDGFDANSDQLQVARCKKAVKLLGHHYDPVRERYFPKLENDIGRLENDIGMLTAEYFWKVVPGPKGKAGDDFYTQCMDGFDVTKSPSQVARCKEVDKQLEAFHRPFPKSYIAGLENHIGRIRFIPGPPGKSCKCDKASFEKWMQEREEKEQIRTLEMRGKIEKIK